MNNDHEPQWICPTCGLPITHCPNPQGKVWATPIKTCHELLPGDTFHWYDTPKETTS
jgi:hypothetical protein